MSGEKCAFAVRDEQGITVVDLTDETIEDRLRVEQFKQKLKQVIADHVLSDLLVNMRDVSYISSVVLGTFISIHKSLRVNGGVLRLCSIRQPVLEVFQLALLDHVFRIHADEAEAVGSCLRGSAQ